MSPKIPLRALFIPTPADIEDARRRVERHPATELLGLDAFDDGSLEDIDPLNDEEV